MTRFILIWLVILVLILLLGHILSTLLEKNKPSNKEMAHIQGNLINTQKKAIDFVRENKEVKKNI